MSAPLSAQDIQSVKTASTMALAAYGITPPGSDWVVLIDPSTGVPFVGTTSSGFQAQAYVNSTGQIYVAVAGTNDSKDVGGWGSALTGFVGNTQQLKDGLDFAAKINQLVQAGGAYAGYSISTSGHSLAEEFTQMFTFVFGWTGFGFDGVGAGSIIKSPDFTQYLTSKNITAVGGTNFISCNTSGIFGISGLLSPGGGVVGSIGSDIQGARQCTMTVDGGLGSALLGLGLLIELGPLAYFVNKLLSGASLHSMETVINPAIQSGHFTVFGSDTSTVQGTSFATPIISGIVALMLQANPNLGWRDVQQILALSARKVNDPNTDTVWNSASNWNGGGMHTSTDYGFGDVDARAAVRLAETWQGSHTSYNERHLGIGEGSMNGAANDAVFVMRIVG